MNKRRIVILTANFKGGVLQFAGQLQQELQEIYGEAIVFVPHNVQSSLSGMQTYTRKNSILPFSGVYRKIADSILRCNPDLVVACDSSLITSRVVLELNKKVPVAMFIHDVVEHPYYQQKIIWIKNQLKFPYIRRAWKKSDKIVLLSENSKKLFSQRYPSLFNKVDVVKLGAHVPVANEKKPDGITTEKDYFLFFGRMDKYKGIINLLNAYTKQRDRIDSKLILAGNGDLTEEEQVLIETGENQIVLLKRYIEDGEMIWLFKNAKAVVLPYIEASQSGVLAIAYWFGKPVVVSNLDGLTEFVRHGETGYIYEKQDGLEEILRFMDNSEIDYSKSIHKYYMEHMDWQRNLKKSFDEVFH